MRHGLLAKLNGKRRTLAYEVFDRILVDYSCVRRVPMPMASPHHATPYPTPLGPASEHVYFCLSSPPHL
jgi:hypothetical protein